MIQFTKERPLRVFEAVARYGHPNDDEPLMDSNDGQNCKLISSLKKLQD